MRIHIWKTRFPTLGTGLELGQKSSFLYFCIQGNLPCIQGNLLCNYRTGLNFLYCRKFSQFLYLQSKFHSTHCTFPCTHKYRKFDFWPSVAILRIRVLGRMRFPRGWGDVCLKEIISGRMHFPGRMCFPVTTDQKRNECAFSC